MKALTTILASILAGMAALTATAQAQAIGDAVAATVNDTPISTFDVQQRARLIMITRGIGEVPPEAQAQLQEQALRDLIEQELKRQEAERWEVTIPEDEVLAELAQIAAGGGGSIELLARELAASGIAIETLKDKIRVDQAWETLVRGRYGPRVKISEDQIDSLLEEMKAERQAEQFLLSEICLPVEAPQQRERIYAIGMQMLGQMQQGVPFQALAQQFSVCPSAARGGDLGWMRAPELEDGVAEVVKQLAEGNVSTPIETEAGDMMKLIAVRSKREAAEKGDPSFELAYAGVAKDLYPYDEARRLMQRLPLTNACNGDGLSTDLGEGIGVTTFPMMPITQIRDDFQDAVLGLRRGDMSGMLESEDHYHMVYVCEMDEGLGLPRRQMIRSRLRADEFELLARRYLRDVERDSDVDIRLFDDGGAQQGS